MKKILFLAVVLGTTLFACAPNEAQAQVPTKKIMKDTSANAEEVYLPALFQGKATDVTMQIVATKLTGTPGGFVVPQGSLDGTNYFTLGSDSLTITNTSSAQSKKWELGTAKYDYYRLWFHSTGTNTTKAWGYMLFR